MPDVGPNFSLPPGYFVQSGDTIVPSQHNPIFEDVAAALNARMMRNGTAPMTGNLQMGANKITGVAAATNPADAPRLDQVTPRSAFLLSASALSLAANEMIYASSANTAAKMTVTAFARTLLDDASAAAMRETLGAVPTGRTITAGPGLSGTGDLGSNITINLGIPSSITADSTNSREDTSHTHAIGEDAIRILIARGGINQQGTFAFARNTSGSVITFGGDISGGNLSPAADDGSNFGSLSGTWTCMGRCPAGAASMFKRRL